MNLIRATVLLLAGLLCGACVVAGGGAEDMVDTATITNTVAPQAAGQAPAPVESPDQASDRLTVRNAVSAADMSVAVAQPQSWANADTGATGVITAISESRAGDTICRTFRTSRQRFDGIALYDGEACTRGGGQWTLTRFSEGS